MHFFHIGQFDVTIMMHTGYSRRPILKDVINVINFDAPASYNNYKENGQLIHDDAGSCLTLISLAPDSEDAKVLDLINRKFAKNFDN